jgi:hypothetical protein
LSGADEGAHLRPALCGNGLPKAKPPAISRSHQVAAWKTAQTHRSNFMQKLHLHSTSEVVLYAIRNQIIPANSHAA